jgi:hypothetical protein
LLAVLFDDGGGSTGGGTATGGVTATGIIDGTGNGSTGGGIAGVLLCTEDGASTGGGMSTGAGMEIGAGMDGVALEPLFCSAFKDPCSGEFNGDVPDMVRSVMASLTRLC